MSRQFLHRLHAKVYADSWKNPLFADPKVKERSSDRLQLSLYTLLTLASLGALCSLLFWFATQSRFAITTIEVSGMRSLPNEAVALSAWEASLSCRHLFVPCLYVWNSSHIPFFEMLSSKYPLQELQSTVQEQTRLFTVYEAVVMIPLRIHDQVWFATPQGVLQYEASQDDINAGVIIPADVYTEIDISALFDQGEAGLHIADEDFFSSLMAYKKAFLAQGISISTLALTDDPGKVVAQTQDGFVIYFTPWEDASRQTERLVSVLAQQTPNEYADIRFGERIYIK